MNSPCIFCGDYDTWKDRGQVRTGGTTFRTVKDFLTGQGQAITSGLEGGFGGSGEFNQLRQG